MLVLLSCAKTMSDVSKVKVPLTTVPRFQKEASEIALQMSQFAVGDLEAHPINQGENSLIL
jgi:cytoplasmic iron level regulating protein YaaA (DUF328/UPF0246 family)